MQTNEEQLEAEQATRDAKIRRVGRHQSWLNTAFLILCILTLGLNGFKDPILAIWVCTAFGWGWNARKATQASDKWFWRWREESDAHFKTLLRTNKFLAQFLPPKPPTGLSS